MVKLRCCLGSKYIHNNWGSWWQWCTWEGGQVPRCKLNHLVTAPGIILKANTSVPFLIWPHRAWPMDAQLLNQQKAKRYHPNSYMYNCIINSCCKIIITLFDLVFRKRFMLFDYLSSNRACWLLEVTVRMFTVRCYRAPRFTCRQRTIGLEQESCQGSRHIIISITFKSTFIFH